MLHDYVNSYCCKHDRKIGINYTVIGIKYTVLYSFVCYDRSTHFNYCRFTYYRCNYISVVVIVVATESNVFRAIILVNI